MVLINFPIGINSESVLILICIENLVLCFIKFSAKKTKKFDLSSQKKEKAKRFARLTGKSGSVIRLSVSFFRFF